MYHQANIRSYVHFLSRNKLYTFVTLLGFAFSLMFVFLLIVYIKQELSVDSFHEKKDRIYLLASSEDYGRFTKGADFANPVANYVKERCPEVENYVRLYSDITTVEDRNNLKKFQVTMLYADSVFFDFFSFPLLQGRPSQVLTGHSAVLSRTMAAKLFPGENPVGKFFKWQDTELYVSGIMEDFPENTHLPYADIVVGYPLLEKKYHQGIQDSWNISGFAIYFLSKEGTDLPSKSDLLLNEFRRDYWMYQGEHAHTDVLFISLEDIYFSGVYAGGVDYHTNSRTLVSIYLSIALLILVIAVINYINLSISITLQRGKESAIKKLLGSSRGAILWQFISEALVTTGISMVLAIALSFIFEPIFNRLFDTDLQLLHQFNFSFIAALILSVFCIGVISGIFPAVVISRFTPIEVVKGTYTRKVKSTYSKILVVFQYVVAITLLIYSIFILRQINYMKNYDVGFETENILVMDNVLKPQQLDGFKDKLMSVGGVENVSYSIGSPLGGSYSNGYQINGKYINLEIFFVDPDFFQVYQIQYMPVMSLHDDDFILVNQEAYGLLEPDHKSHRVFYENTRKEEIIGGIVDNFYYKSLQEQRDPFKIHVVKNFTDTPWVIHVKLAKGIDIYQKADEIKRIYSEYNGNEFFEADFADEIIQSWYEKEEQNGYVIVTFTILTILILMMGIIAMTMYFVRQKEKEIALRKIQGATELDILKLVNWDFVKGLLLAFVLAVPAGWYVSIRFLQDFAYHVKLDGWVFILSGGLILLLSIVFVTLQSWRIAVANPVKSIKNE